MRLIRSWPAVVPEGRSYVHDGFERLVMDEYDYRILEHVDDDVLLVEWDIAVGQVELLTLAGRARAEPDRVHVAPYPIYRSTIGKHELRKPVWPYRRFSEDGASMRFVDPGDTHCHMFAFGVIYLPRLLVQRFLTEWSGHFSDVSFSQWHYREAEHREVPIAWDCRAVHLNYSTPTI